MNYQELSSTLVEKDRKSLKDLLTKRNLIISSFVLLSLFLTLSIITNIILISLNPNTCESKPIVDDHRPLSPTTLKPEVKPAHNGTQLIECKREFFLFHQDQNHVCEVQGVVIKNDTQVIVKGNELTTVLHIFSIEVYRLPKEIFEEFKNLKNLIVNGNHLKVIERGTFTNAAKSLEVLRLSNNELTELNSCIFNISSLKTLDLGRNRIERIASEAFVGLDALERLYLSDNNIKSLASDVFYSLKNLSFLSLENNQLTRLDDYLFKFNPLMKSLGLSNNSFTDLRNELFRDFENLIDLSISELRILELDLNGTTVQTLVMRNTDLRNLTLFNFPKILVSYNTPIEYVQFIISDATADFNRLPNYGGIFFNKNVRFVFRFQKEIASEENLEKYDNKIRTHIRIPELDYAINDTREFIAVEYIPRASLN